MRMHLMIGVALLFSFGQASAQHVPDRQVPGGALPPQQQIPVQDHAPAMTTDRLPIPPIPVGNHYICYPVKTAPNEQPVKLTATLRDQFGTGSVAVNGITRVCNPVVKILRNGETSLIVDEKLHLTCYKVTFSVTPPSVTIHNQFDIRRVNLDKATELCLPTGKKK